jgi:hypothetical protein
VDAGWARSDLRAQYDGERAECVHAAAGWGAPVQLTHFNSKPGLVLAYAWSRDGKKLAITRGRYNDADVVMFSGFR